MKKLLLSATAIGVISSISFASGIATAATGIGNQADIDKCAALFPEAHCASWYAPNSGHCGCNGCLPTYPNSQATYPEITRSGYTLHDQCYCNRCSCSNNPDPSKRGGKCTCGSNGADFSTCKTSDPCTSSNCKNWPVTINGVFYCATNTRCESEATGSRVAYYVSTECANGNGVNNDRCAVAQCATGTISQDKSQCVCPAGQWGKVTSQSSSTCTDCPGDGTSDVDFHPSFGPYRISACYLPAGTSGSDETGNWTIPSGKCYHDE